MSLNSDNSFNNEYDYSDDVYDESMWSTSFCADPLLTYSPNSTFPSIGNCFQHAFLDQLAPLLLLLSLPILWISLSNAKIEYKATKEEEEDEGETYKLERVPHSEIELIKKVLIAVLAGSRLFLFVIASYELFWQDKPIPLVELFYPLTHLITLAFLFYYTEQFLRLSLAAPGPIFCVWLFFVLTGLPEFFNLINHCFGNEFYFLSTCIAKLLWWPLCFFQFILSCFSTIPNGKPNNSPEEKVSFLNNQLFIWFDPLVKIGHKRPIEEKDVFRLLPELRAKRLFRRWCREREKQLGRSEFHHSTSLLNGPSKTSKEDIQNYSERTPLLQTSKDSKNINQKQKLNKNKPPSIIACLWRLFKWEIIGAMIAKLFSDILQITTPLLLGQLISFTEDTSLPTWWGFLLAGGLFLASEIRSLLQNNYFNMMNSIGCKVQSVLTSAVYAKVNLMAIDVDRFYQVIPLLQQIWSSPLQVVLSLYVLYQFMGWSVIGGVLFMIALIPCNLCVVRRTKLWQMEQMTCKDSRLRMLNEVLTGIRAVKLYAWELPMRRVIDQIREHEVQLIRKAALLRTCSDVLNLTSPYFVAIITFALYIFSDPIHNILSPEIAFVSLTLFSQLRIPMMVLAELIGQLVQTAVSNRRLKHFFVSGEIDPKAVERDLDPQYERAIDVEFASFDWKAQTKLVKTHSHLPHGHQHLTRPGGLTNICIPYSLNNLELHLRRGLLVAVVGRVGSGKTSLLNALLGEMNKVYGFVGLRGRVAYVPQQPWVLNRTVRENIFFSILDEGEKPDLELYARVVDACALKSDFLVLPEGDQTEIGERGINLSGGQKARVNLARALYHQADIYLLDDPLSAVDAIVGRHLFDYAIGPESLAKGSTRVLVTHSLSYLAETDWIVVMEEVIENNESDSDDSTWKGEETPSSPLPRFSTDELTEGTLTMSLMSVHSAGSFTNTLRRRTQSSRSSLKKSRISINERKTTKTIQNKVGGKLIEKEEAEAGRVSPSIYLAYFAAMRWPLFIGFIFFLFSQFLLNIIQSLWLTSWSDDNITSKVPKMSVGFRYFIYALLGLGIVLSLGLSNILQILGSVTASIRLHGPLLDRVLHAPISFFDTTPLGRILNRFGKEFDVVDLRLASTFRMLGFSLLMVLQVFILISLSLPIFTLLIIPTVLVYGLILRYFIPTSRQLQRLTSVTRSPLYNLFAETINGTTSIRAYGVAQTFFNHFCSKVDIQIGCRYFALIANRWLSVRLELIGNLMILFCSVMAVFSRDWGTVTAGVIGLAVSKSLDVTVILGFLVRNINDAEMSIVSVERILEYRDCPQEAAWESPKGRELPADWPSRGAVHFQKYSCRYRPELDLSLRGITAEIKPGEKVGIVGRTGAGKTSFALALFRIIEAAEGRILIDGVNIAKVGLQELRSRITIIPQDPVLFSGTLRFNLDPFDVYKDHELWTALEQVHLKHFVETQPKKLFYEIAESGENISIGQRQLLCMARAILRRSPLIVLDEATASIDSQTDDLIQRAIRTEFRQSTILTIAHRISTVMDYDRIMVLSAGKLVEFDTPEKLAAEKTSHFHALVMNSSNIEK
uniref:ABC-type glutathione-S-conjugate transporter n=1 Tax=Meloidogyne hapla TaxID=6305 RepID=A0A1I8BIX4_MELHA